MDDKKKESFINRAGKKKAKYQNLAKGGVVRRMYDAGGPVSIGPAGPYSYNPATGGSVYTGPALPSTPKMLGPGLTGAPATTAAGTTLTGPSAGGAIGNAVNPANLGPTGAINTALGTSNTFQAAAAPLQAGTTAGQLNTAYGGTQGALTNQGTVAGALTPQAAAAAQEQAGLAGAYGAIANGQGPNPALAQLNETTQQNIANQGALIAGQRGASSNVGLIARQAAQQGAATQQQAVQGGATLEAEQELGALSGLGSLSSQQANEATAATGAATTGQVQEQGVLQGANTALNAANVTQQNNINSVNAGISTANQAQNNNLLNDVGNGVSAVAPYLAAGASSLLGSGGNTYGSDTFTDQYGNPAATSGANFNGPVQPAYARGGRVIPGPHKSHVANFLFAQGGKVPALVSPGEIYLSPEKVRAVMNGANPFKVGEKIPGKAKVSRDSTKNDTVPRELEEGGVVLPKHITKKRDPEKAELFIRRAMHMKRAS